MNMLCKLLFVYASLQLVACTSSGPVRNPVGQEGRGVTGSIARGDLSQLHARLLDQYWEWKGTPYRLGGLDKRGVDCSGFVHLTYRAKAGLTLPRTTELQSVVGGGIAQDELQTGDLVFFKINGSTRHVGIYLDKNQFLHASKSQGVMISNLNNPYWQDHYWKSKRLPVYP